MASEHADFEKPGMPKKPRKPVDVSASIWREPVTLIKGAHRWTFACTRGDEQALLTRLSQLAAGPDVPFDWFDAALVSHQLNKRLKPGLHRIDGHISDSRP